VLTRQNHITRALVRQRDLFGRWSNRWTPPSGGRTGSFSFRFDRRELDPHRFQSVTQCDDPGALAGDRLLCSV
jgi:hypothetical protein